jgi:hypothetical protein
MAALAIETEDAEMLKAIRAACFEAYERVLQSRSAAQAPSEEEPSRPNRRMQTSEPGAQVIPFNRCARFGVVDAFENTIEEALALGPGASEQKRANALAAIQAAERDVLATLFASVAQDATHFANPLQALANMVARGQRVKDAKVHLRQLDLASRAPATVIDLAAVRNALSAKAKRARKRA